MDLSVLYELMKFIIIAVNVIIIYYYRISSKNSALLIIRHPLPNDSLIFRQRSSCVYAINGNGMRTQTQR